MSGKVSLLIKFAGIAARDYLGLSRNRKVISEVERNISLLTAVEWLCKSQDLTSNDGYSQGYYLYRHGDWGWLPSYRETTGYIVESFFTGEQVLNDSDLRLRAIAAADWLCSIQEEDGSITNPNFGNNGLVFDTGQVLFGFVKAYRETKVSRYLDCAIKAGEWLCHQTDGEGLWTINTHKSCFHAYNTRVAWAMLELWDITGRSNHSYEMTARTNLDFAVKNQRNGWYVRNSFNDDGKPFTHNIAYAIRGCWESGCLLDNDIYMQSAVRGIDAILGYIKKSGFVPGIIDEMGKTKSNSCCLTGNCQLAIIMYKMYKNTGNDIYREKADLILDYVISCQNMTITDPGIRGAIKGSHPIAGSYTPMGYPNWAAKFFIDALILRKGIK